MNDSERPFKVPWALDTEGNLVAAKNGIPHANYNCPGCLNPLVFKAGDIKVKHFAHKAGFGCSWESYLHKAAKLQIKSIVDSWLHYNGNAPVIITDCHGSEWWECDGKSLRPLKRGKIDEVCLEYPIDDLRPDAVLLLNGKPVLAIEILVTHEVDDAKRTKSRHRWIELLATDVMDHPLEWRPIQHNIDSLTKCNICKRIDFGNLKIKIDRHIDSFEKWLVKAKNPAAALNSTWWIDKIEEEFKVAFTTATRNLERPISSKTPEWDNEPFYSGYFFDIYNRIQNKYKHSETESKLPPKPDDDIPF